ncbi:Six-hairpin glycosidase [Auriculariales sp. MPI-PUGE-AT-0066]|nr:Six-hairpin glycosidase [Auriculariales sp. MPI-PUGE-AT-0066]
MVDNSKRPWERGTMMEAIIEHERPELSVFGAQQVPVGAGDGPLPDAALQSLDEMLADRKDNGPFQWDGSAADPASVGTAAMMHAIFSDSDKYKDAVKDELIYLHQDVPRDSSYEIISHRADEFQAWADFLAMVPPTIAYYGVYQSDGYERERALKFAWRQCQGYRDILRDPDTGLYRHIMEGPWNDQGLWATGQGWAAFGMLRVHQTISKSAIASSLTSEAQDLLNWTKELIDATWAHQLESGALFNYIDRQDFEDSSGTAAVALASYRYALITGTTVHESAEKALRRLTELVDDDGWVQRVVNPIDFANEGEHSPEAQSFVVMLDVASREYYNQSGTAPSLPTSSADSPSEPTDSPTPEPTKTGNCHRRRHRRRM